MSNIQVQFSKLLTEATIRPVYLLVLFSLLNTVLTILLSVHSQTADRHGLQRNKGKEGFDFEQVNQTLVMKQQSNNK